MGVCLAVSSGLSWLPAGSKHPDGGRHTGAETSIPWGHIPGPQESTVHPKDIKYSSSELTHMFSMVSGSWTAPISHLGQSEAHILVAGPCPRCPLLQEKSQKQAVGIYCQLHSPGSQGPGKEVQDRKLPAVPPGCCPPPTAAAYSIGKRKMHQQHCPCYHYCGGRDCWGLGVSCPCLLITLVWPLRNIWAPNRRERDLRGEQEGPQG